MCLYLLEADGQCDYVCLFVVEACTVNVGSILVHNVRVRIACGRGGRHEMNRNVCKARRDSGVVLKSI